MKLECFTIIITGFTDFGFLLVHIKYQVLFYHKKDILEGGRTGPFTEVSHNNCTACASAFSASIRQNIFKCKSGGVQFSSG